MIKYFLVKPKVTYVSVCFPIAGACQSTIHKYYHGECDTKESKSECQCVSAVLATFVSLLKLKLTESVKNILSSGHSEITGYIYAGGHFGLTIRCESKTSSVGKNLVLIKNCLEAMPSTFKIFKKFVVGSDESAFNWCIGKLAAGIKNMVVAVVKPGKEFNDKIKSRFTAVVSGIEITSKEKGTEPADAKQKPKHDECCIAVKGAAERFLVGMYLSSAKVHFTHSGDCLELIVGGQKPETIKGKLNDKEKIAKFAEQKLLVSKKAAELPVIALLRLAGNGQILADEVDKLLKTDFKSSANMIEKSF